MTTANPPFNAEELKQHVEYAIRYWGHGATGTALQWLWDSWQEMNSTISWDTTCFNCAKKLDYSYSEFARREQAEDVLRSVLNYAIYFDNPRPAQEIGAYFAAQHGK